MVSKLISLYINETFKISCNDGHLYASACTEYFISRKVLAVHEVSTNHILICQKHRDIIFKMVINKMISRKLTRIPKFIIDLGDLCKSHSCYGGHTEMTTYNTHMTLVIKFTIINSSRVNPSLNKSKRWCISNFPIVQWNQSSGWLLIFPTREQSSYVRNYFQGLINLYV